MPLHDGEFCRGIEAEILEIVRGSSDPVSIMQIDSVMNSHHNPEVSFYELFHHAYALVEEDRLRLIIKDHTDLFAVPK
jgi:hypothetical protein